MNLRLALSRLTTAMISGVLVAWAANVVEGVVRDFHRAHRDPGDWFASFVLYAWFGLLLGLVWGGILVAIDVLRRGKKPIFRVFLLPGILFLNAFIVGGYWLNHSRFMPPFWTVQGKLWTLALGLGILLPCLLLALILWGTHPMTPKPPRRGAALLFLIGLAAVLVPPAYFVALGRPSLPSRTTAKAEGPPVIVILIDTLRRDHLEMFGYHKPTSPHLKEFAGDALLFEHSSTTSNLTIPSVATLFTGLYPSQHQVIWAVRDLPKDAATMAETFRRHGYRTAAFVGNPAVRPELGFRRGFEDYYPEPPPPWIHDRKTSLELISLRMVHGKSSTQLNTLVERSLDWLESTSNRPPFLYLHALEPHSPYEPLAEDSAPFLPAGTTKLHRWPPMIWDYRTGEGWSTWEDLTNLPDVSEERREVMAALYDGEIRFVDRKLGQFFERLKESDLYDRSIIVFVADHGEEFNDHGGWFHGLTVFEEMTSMPLLVKLPRSLGGGIRTTLSVDMVDVFPTLCGLTRMPAPESIRGEDRAEELLAAARGRDVLGFPSCFVERPPHLYSFRVDRWKIIQKTSGGKTVHKLYDLEFDPREQEDLAYVFPDTLVRMRTLLREIIRQVTPAEGFAAQDGPDNLDPETERILRNLGYIN